MAAHDIFDAISDSNRRFLLEELQRSPMTVNALAEKLPITRPAVSQHLKVLLDAQLVNVQKQGTSRIYTINPLGFMRLAIWIEQFWDGED